MINMHCLRAETLMQRRAAGLLSGETLQLEDHLAGCSTCSAQAQMLTAMHGLVAAAGSPLDSVTRTRAITSALSAVQRSKAPSGADKWLWPAAALALASAVALFVAWPKSTTQHEVAQNVTPASAAINAVPKDRLLEGTLDVDGHVQTTGAAVADGADLRSVAGAKVVLAHATVELRPDTTIRWSGATRELQLRAGSVVADVDPAAHRSFTVHTERFSVLVLGTRFEVSEDSVVVTRGRVQVVGPDGAELAMLEAGQRFDAPSTEAEAAPAEDTQPSVAQPHAPRADAAALLDRARGELASRQPAAARRTLDAVLQLSLQASLHAEAMSLRADCALVDGDKDAAATAYLRVAERFAKLPAGENALFAAARLRAERGQGPSAARLLSLYLARYPNGRFVKEAGKRLHELGVSADPAR